jgi:hypothetical protein
MNVYRRATTPAAQLQKEDIESAAKEAAERAQRDTEHAKEQAQERAKQQEAGESQRQAEFCKNFPFDQKCPGHDQYTGGNSSLACLNMERQRGSVNEFATTITGTVRNNCRRDFAYVQVTFKLYDRADNVVGTALANQTNLKAGETWKFEATGTPPAQHDRFDEVTAY